MVELDDTTEDTAMVDEHTDAAQHEEHTRLLGVHERNAGAPTTSPPKRSIDRLLTALGEDALEHALVVSYHGYPQPSPQEWECGCITASYVTDRDTLRGERPFEMRLAERCYARRCEVRRFLLDELLIDERYLPSSEWPWTTDRMLDAQTARANAPASASSGVA